MQVPRRTRLVWSVPAVVLAASAGLALVLTTPDIGPGDALTDLDGALVQPDPGSVPSARELAGMDLVDDTGARFRAPDLGLDVALGAMDEVDGTIRPPGFRSAYLIRNRGVAPAQAEQGTVYVAVHSVLDGRAPGNHLIDPERARATVLPGDELIVGDRTYRVTQTRTVAKDELPTQSDLWVDVPGRLVVVTCLQGGDEPATRNVVLIGQLVP